MIITLAIFFTVAIVMCLYFTTFEFTKVLPALISDWKQGKKIELINDLMIMVMIYCGAILGMVGIWTSI